MTYEFEVINYGQPYFHELTLFSLTGLEFDEVHSYVKSIGKERWGGQLYIKAIQNLGSNTKPRFVKFNTNNFYRIIILKLLNENGKNVGKV